MRWVIVSLMLLLALAAGCRMLFWRSGGPDRSIAWLGGRSFAEVRLHYREKAPLDPLSGTTHKRDYRTEVLALEIRGKNVRSAPAFEFPGWIVADSLYAVRPNAFVFLGGTGDDYGSAARAVYVRERDAAVQLHDLPQDDSMQIIAAVPSPDAKFVAVLEELRPGMDAPPGTDLWRLRIGVLASNKLQFANDVYVSDIPYTDGPVWAPDSGGAYVRAADRTIYVDARTNRARAAAEPRCWQLRTNSGGSVSEDGVSIYYDEAGEEYLVQNGDAPCQ